MLNKCIFASNILFNQLLYSGASDYTAIFAPQSIICVINKDSYPAHKHLSRELSIQPALSSLGCKSYVGSNYKHTPFRFSVLHCVRTAQFLHAKFTSDCMRECAKYVSIT